LKRLTSSFAEPKKKGHVLRFTSPAVLVHFSLVKIPCPFILGWSLLGLPGLALQVSYYLRNLETAYPTYVPEAVSVSRQEMLQGVLRRQPNKCRSHGDDQLLEIK
jgi:hypothetical protein